MTAKYFDKIINLGISDTNIYKGYAFALFKLGNYDLAIKYFKLAIALDPYNSDNFYNVGNALYCKAYDSNNKEDFLKASEY